MPRPFRRLAGRVLGVLVWAWVRSLRVFVEGEQHLGSSRVLVFFHGQQMALLTLARRLAPLAVLVSHSADGELQTGVMRAQGLHVVRGSTSRGGVRALAQLVKLLRGGLSAAFAVDGPRGPAGAVRPGAAFAALRSGVPLVPLASAARHAVVLRRTWDAFEIPLPFSQVRVVIGAPLDAELANRHPEALAAAIRGARERALRGAGRLPGAPSSESPGTLSPT